MATDRPTGLEFATRSEVIARHAMAATSQPLATQAALHILRSGGSAVDAAIAANAVLCLTEPTGCGLGGDLFAIVWDSASSRLHGLNGSGRSPAALTGAILREAGLESIPQDGPLPVSVPGCVDGWFTLHERFGKLPMDAVLDPAIRYAREGFPVTEVIARDWARSAEKLEDQPGFRETFLPGGRAPAKGEIFRNEALAATLETIASEGRDAFYRGSIAGAIDAFMQRTGGYLRAEDLAAHSSEWVDPVSCDYRGYQLWELPPNGQGIAALQMLNILEGFDLRSAGFGSPDHLHWFIEAKKLAFADRARFYADPAFGRVPVQELISKEYAAGRRAQINPARAALTDEPGNPAIDEGDTVYLSVADQDRNMVSLIQSNYRGFGSGLCPDGLGFCLQNRGELFDLAEGKPNSYAPGKRPFHTIIPAFVTREGKPWLSFGVMGGATQPQAHVQVLLNLVDFDMNLQEAGDAPRVVHTGSSQPTGESMKAGGRVHLESGFPYGSVRELLERGHLVTSDIGIYGGYQAILYDREKDVYYGASESRKDGQAAGY
ncbi:MAG TPA: gamma-glutamyltransferase [Verrucomicrobiales bacterium]|nr:gamma-glutamyltransferase [Verrucomicrobiales bacterium]